MISRIGLDPEVAIINKETGLGRSAHMFIDKKQTFMFFKDFDKEKKNGRAGSELERDGAAVEVRSIIPSACRDNIIPYVAEALRQAQLQLEKKWNGQFTLSSTPKFVLDEESLKNPPKDVVEFGCRPDVNAYTLEPKDPECDVSDRRRWTGGHIHGSQIRGAVANPQVQATWAVLYDYLVAAPFVAILGEKFSEGEAERREMYGQPGSFRFDDTLSKIEFRTLSGRVLLHPTLLGWAMGSMKMMFRQGDPSALLEKLRAVFPTEQVYDTVLHHDVATAEEIVNGVFQLLPNYQVNKNALANPLGGGGGGTYNPYFFEQAAKVFIAGNKEGVTFPDDLKHNWGLFEDYMPKHHAYWGIQTAMVNLCDDDIFPQNAILPKVWPKDLLQKPVYTHPLNGGAMQYTTPGAINWLA